MRVSVLSRYCECGSILNAGAHRHAEGCPRNQERAWFRVRVLNISVANDGRWEMVRLFLAGALFYFGLAINAAADFGSAGYIGGGLSMLAGLLVLLTCCRQP
jgi:hypothetical protein